MIASTDVSGTVLVYALTRTSSHGWIAEGKLFELSQPDSTINYVLLHPAKSLVLVSETESTKLLNVATATELTPLPHGSGNLSYTSWSWLTKELGKTSIPLGVSKGQVDIYLIDLEREEDNDRPLLPVTVHLHGQANASIIGDIKKVVINTEDKYLVAELESESPASWASSPKLAVFATDSLIAVAQTKAADRSNQIQLMTEKPILTIPGRIMKTLFGFHGSDTLVFLDHNLWVRSIDISKIPKHTTDSKSVELLADRHFFIPREFIGGSNGVDGLVTPDHGTIVFPKEGELAVVRNALEWSFTASGVGNSASAVAEKPRRRKGSGNAVVEEEDRGEEDDDFDITALRRRITGNITI